MAAVAVGTEGAISMEGTLLDLEASRDDFRRVRVRPALTSSMVGRS